MEKNPLTRVKICCIGGIEEARLAVACGASALGLVSDMPSGPGVIEEPLIARIAAVVPPGVASFLLTSRQSAAALFDGAREQQESKLRRTGILYHFEFILTSESEGMSKPDPSFFARACDLAASSPSDTFYIGNNIVKDAIGAHGAGLNGVWLNRAGKQVESEVYAIESLGDFVPRLAKQWTRKIRARRLATGTGSHAGSHTEFYRNVARYRVIRDYEAAYKDPITIEVGEGLQVEERDSEWPGWLWCVSPSGKAGWVPSAWLERSGSTALAIRSYSALELSVAEGQVLEGAGIESGWVWATDSEGRQGWIPLDCLVRI